MDLASSYKVNMNFPNFFKKQNFQPKKNILQRIRIQEKKCFAKKIFFKEKNI